MCVCAFMAATSRRANEMSAGTERPIKLTNANTSDLGIGVDVGNGIFSGSARGRLVLKRE